MTVWRPGDLVSVPTVWGRMTGTVEGGTRVFLVVRLAGTGECVTCKARDLRPARPVPERHLEPFAKFFARLEDESKPGLA